MAKVTIEPWTPVHRSLCWRLADRYFAQRGVDAWTKGEVPHDATDNYGMARQHARFFVDHVASLAAEGRRGGELWVLEAGCGLGRFAANFVRALSLDAGAAGRALIPRLRFVLSDYIRDTVAEIAEGAQLGPLVEAGTIIPAVLDLRAPERLVDLTGAPLATPPLLAVYTNYLCCVLPPRNLQRRGARWFEQLVQIEAEVGDDPSGGAPLEARDLLADPTQEALLAGLSLLWGWRPIGFEGLLPAGLHAAVVERTLEGLPDATLGYPATFIDFLLSFAPRLDERGVFMISDYGRVERDDLAGLHEREPQIYGNSLAFEVHFPVFDALAERAGWAIRRTEDRTRSLQTALLSPNAPLSGADALRFDEHYRRAHDGEDLVDFYDIAMRASDEGDYDRAARFYRRCVEQDPENVAYLFKLADAEADAGALRRALALALRARELPGASEHDLDFLLGRVYALLEEYDAARAWYERSLQREPHPVTLTNLGSLYEHEARWSDARAAYARALTLQPDYERAAAALEALDQAGR